MVLLEYKKNYGHHIIEKLQQWRHEEIHCDFTLISSDGKKFPAHRSVLAASSEYMNALITGAFKERMHDHATLDCIHSKVGDYELCYLATVLNGFTTVYLIV